MKTGKKQILILRQERPYSQIYTISGPTQIGRAHGLKWKVESRKIPKQFQRLEAVISIEDSKFVSRNHAGIYQRGGKFYLVDLNSLNRTFLNGEDISSASKNPVPKKLALDDVITFASDLELKVVGFKYPDQNNHCLMVGHDGGNLRGVKKDLDKLEAQLVKRGFEGNIRRLYNQDAAKDKVLGELEKLAYLTTSDSHFIFHYSGHGNQKGLDLGNFDGITPSELYSALANIRGKKAVILDCCHAGIFLSREYKEEIPSNSLILTASSKTGKAYERPNYAIAGGAYMGRFSAALVEYLSANKARLDLKDFKKRLEEVFTDKIFSLHYQKPGVAGESFTMMTACSIVH